MEKQNIEEPRETDFTVQNHGSILVLNANTEAARAWVEEYLPAERLTWGRNGTVIEPRYVEDILDGIAADGLSIE